MDTTSEAAFRTQANHDGITHISTGVAVLEDGKILMTRRVKDDYLGGYYELPGGGIDEGENIQEGALRELKEETGLTATTMLATFEGFDYSTDKKPKVRQANFLVEADTTGIMLNPNEHDAYMWVSIETLQTIHTTPPMAACVENAFKAARTLATKEESYEHAEDERHHRQTY